MTDYDERIALVTGGLRGIGRGIAERLLAEGMQVFLVDIENDETAADLMQGVEGKASYLKLNVIEETQWQSVIGEIKSTKGRLDCLVNNAGVDCVGPVEELTYESWRRIMSINVDGVFLGIKTSATLLAKTGQTTPAGSSIINISSVMGKVGYIDTSAYNTSKGAVTLMSKAVGVEFATKRTPIRVNSLHPGFVQTPLLDTGMNRMVAEGLAEKPEDIKGIIAQATPMGRIADTSEIASGAWFLASDDSGYMTGAELVIDGGWTAQ